MSRRLIIIEGPTAAGKSTLVAKLAKRYGLPVIHRAVPPAKLKDPKVVEEWFADALNMRASEGLILDRWVYSNRVYAPILRNQPKVPALALERLAVEKFDRCDTIFLTSDVGTLMRRISRREKPTLAPLRDLKAMTKVVNGYQQQFIDCNLRKIQLTGTQADVVRGARNFIEQETHGQDQANPDLRHAACRDACQHCDAGGPCPQGQEEARG